MNPTGLCMCGCGEPAPIAAQNHARHGWVKGQPLKFVRGHANRKTPVMVVHEDRGHNTPCHVWRGATAHGYGNMRRGGRNYLAHRWHFEQVHGPIPDGMQLDHLCRVPLCVNPEHLEPVTNAENTRRGRKAKLTPEVVELIRGSSERTSLIASRLGLSYDTVWAARTGRSWS